MHQSKLFTKSSEALLGSPPRYTTSLRSSTSRLAPCAVLAPADVKSRKANQGKTQPSSRGLSEMLFSLSKVWEREDQSTVKVEELMARTAERAKEADLIEEQEKEKKAQAPLADVRAFLRPAGVMELRYIRLLSHLSAQTYGMEKLTSACLRRHHGLRLVTTSLACDIGLKATANSPRKALAEADAMAADPYIVLALKTASGAAPPSPTTTSNVVPASMKALSDLQPIGPKGASKQTSPADLVASSFSVAAGAAAAAAGPIANNITAFTNSVTASMPVRSVAAQLQSAASAGHSTAVATIATVTAALETNFSKETKSRVPRDSLSPTAWFVADSAAEEGHTRYFVIQGSDNLDHWKVNLTFDPVVFEDPQMGIKVHRGVYETAQILYERFLPLVKEHLATSPHAKICFTGHSLGGSLGTLLALMYIRRGVLPKHALTPVYTFGAPAVFCEGDACTCDPQGNWSCDVGGPKGVLAQLGLPEGTIRNIMMHKDIVPRAFACDYALVADLLKRVDSFKQHRCLSGNRQLLFNFIGKVMVLQPDEDMTFVSGEGLHPMLPPGAGLYFIRPPPASTTDDACTVSSSTWDAMASLDPVPSASASFIDSEAGYESDDEGCGAKVPASLGEAIWELMNNPHPLDILGDPAAYGPTGNISRYHNPDNYTKALGGALRARDWRGIVEKARAVGMKYHVPEVVKVSKKMQEAQQEAHSHHVHVIGGKSQNLGTWRHLPLADA